MLALGNSSSSRSRRARSVRRCTRNLPNFSDAEILELGLVGGILAGVAKFMFAYDLVEKEDACPFHSQR